jgi:hypothetical protein
MIIRCAQELLVIRAAPLTDVSCARQCHMLLRVTLIHLSSSFVLARICFDTGTRNMNACLSSTTEIDRFFLSHGVATQSTYSASVKCPPTTRPMEALQAGSRHQALCHPRFRAKPSKPSSSIKSPDSGWPTRSSPESSCEL